MITHREFAETLPDHELTESQRALLDVDVSTPFSPWQAVLLREIGIHRLGEVLAYDVSLAMIERHGSTDKSLLNSLNLMAHRLLEYDKSTAAYFGDNAAYEIVEVASKETFGDRDYRGTYTPDGYVKEIAGELKQKIVTFDMRSVHRYAGETNYFNFSSNPKLRLYTDNLTARPPLWEYTHRSSDIMPGRNMDPHFFHLPRGFEDEELALSVVQSLARVVEASNDAEREWFERAQTAPN